MKVYRLLTSIFPLISLLFLSCDENAGRTKGGSEITERKGGGAAVSINNYNPTKNDIAFAEWFIHQAFCIQVITSDNGNQIIPFHDFSMAETKAEDVIEIQRESMQKFLGHQGFVDKITKLSLWFETQLQAEKVLLDFVTGVLLLVPEEQREWVVTDDKPDVLLRQKFLLEIIRRERDKGRSHN